MKQCFEKPAMDVIKFSNSIYTYPCNVSAAYMNQNYGNNVDAGMAFIYSHCPSFDPNDPNAWQ